MTRAAARRHAGLTLIELLVGLTLLGLFLSGVYTVAIGTMVAKRRIEQTASIYTAGPALLDLVEEDLRGAYLNGVKDGKAFKAMRENVGGEECTILDMITTVDSKIQQEFDGRWMRSDITEIGYRLRQHDTLPGVLELYRREQFFFDDDLLRGGNYYLVYDRVRSFVIDFFEQPDTTSTTSSLSKEEGKETWDSKDDGGLPRAAKITLVLAPPEELLADIEDTDQSYTFIRWVVFPNADDRKPGEEDAGPGEGDGNNGPR